MSAHWFVEGCIGQDAVPRRFALKSMPCRIGRSAGADVTLPVDHVSGIHAELFAVDDGLWLRDLGSTNGTFHNGQRISDDVQVRPGDVIHFAHAEFVLGHVDEQADDGEERTVLVGGAPDPKPVSHPARANALRDLLSRSSVVAHFQPLFALDSRALLGFELLGRGTHPALPPSPGPLFELAERVGLAARLSEAFRCEGMRAARDLPQDLAVFVNTHPSEIGTRELIRSVDALRSEAPDLPVVLEIHEATITGAGVMRELRSALDDLSIGLAYDDFGAGQARLLELVEVPPDYLKVDISIVRDVDRAPPARRRMLEVLIRMANDLGIRCVAEGVEREGELEACRELGFDFAQGFLLGRPTPVDLCAEFVDGVERAPSKRAAPREQASVVQGETLVFDAAGESDSVGAA